MFLRVLLLTFLVCIPSSTLALDPFGQNFEPFSFKVSPAYPRPYDTVSVQVESNQLNLTASIITISVNEEVVSAGGGVRSANGQVGGAGETTTIRVLVESPGGQTYTKELLIRPSDVSLVVEPMSTTHPFYQGAPLVASEGRVRIIALPDLRTTAGARIPAETLVYTWRLEDRILETQSGIGRTILDAAAPIRYRSANVRVTVTNRENTAAGEARVLIAPVDPLVRIYRHDPLSGVEFDRALGGTYTMEGGEETFRVVPYYFGTPPALSWSVNSTASGSENELTVRSAGSGTGTASVGVSAKNPGSFQAASQSFSVAFGADAGIGIFGF